jgi:hypothetical protein
MSLTDVVTALEQSSLAAWVNSSPLILGALSGVHLIGFTLVVGTALVAGLHMMGVAFADRPSREVIGRASRVLAVGVAANVLTGLMQAAPRAGAALANWIFVSKMTLLVAAILAQLAVPRFAAHADAGAPFQLRVWSVVTTALWLAVGVTGAAFILLE